MKKEKIIFVLVFFLAFLFFIFYFLKYKELIKQKSNQPVFEEKTDNNNIPDQILILDKDIPIKENIPDQKDKGIPIPGVYIWNGTDPYPSVDWSLAKPELKNIVSDFEKAWGAPLKIRQVYRPAEYTRHIRSVWEMWQYINNKDYKIGYGCENYSFHIDKEKLPILNQEEKDLLKKEAGKHGFINGDTPPACQSDHSLGIAVDITPPINTVEYKRWIEIGVSVGLCHYIAKDEPHFALSKYLPENTNCFEL